MSPMKVLTAATGDAARAMKLDARLGTLQTGKDADFVVLGANPITDIKNTQRIEAVWIGGRRVESKN
jgi:imidazolonepropionase-like amidohydrolase